MDGSKQPGIKIDAILLSESLFKRKPDVKIPLDIKLDVNAKHTINEEKKQLITQLQVCLNSESDSVFGRFVFVGIFSTNDNSNMTLDEFSKNNAPALIFPYIREEIHNRSLKAGLPPILIQPVNLVAMLKN